MLQKITMFLTVLLLTLATFGTSAQVATADLTILADLFTAEDTYIFASIRADDDFVATLDGYAAQIGAETDLYGEELDLSTALDQAVTEAQLGDDFETAIRPWLGDTVGLGFMLSPFADPENLENLSSELLPTFAAELADVEAGQAALVSLFTNQEGREPTEGTIGDFTTFTFIFDQESGEPRASDIMLAFTDDAVLVGQYAQISVLVMEGKTPLTAYEDFNTTVGLLTEDAYNVLSYGNQPLAATALDATLENLAEDSFRREQLETEREFYQNTGSFVVGARIEEERIFNIEVAVNGRGGETLFSVLDTGAVDFAFAENITTRFPLVIHLTNLAGFIDESIVAANEINEDSGEAVDQANEASRTAIGLSLEEIYGWMVNDYAIVFGPSVQASDASGINDYITDLPLEFGILIDPSADEATAVRVVDAVETVMREQLAPAAEGTAEFTIEREGDLITVTAIDQTGNVPFPLSVNFGLTGGAFVLATPGVLMEGTPLPEGETFQAAAGTLVVDPTSVFYIDFKPLVPFLRPLAPLDPSVGTSVSVLDLLDFATISSTIGADGNGYAKAVIAFK